MKLSKSTDVSARSKIRIICLPEKAHAQIVPSTSSKIASLYTKRKDSNIKVKQNPESAFKYLERINNLTRTVLNNLLSNKQKNLRYNIRVAINKSENDGDKSEGRLNLNGGTYVNNVFVKNGDDVEVDKDVRNNAKKLHFGSDSMYSGNNHLDDGGECVVTGWGRSQTNGSLTDTLLEASVPQLPIEACQGKYPENLPLRSGHLCAGNTDGSSGTCVVSKLE
jgi:hypothetical protein